MREQLQKQLARLRELRIKKVEEPGLLIILYFLQIASSQRHPCTLISGEFYGVEDLVVQNVDVMTDASAFTAFTRYTKAPTAILPYRA
jgi:elongator complex protein 1